MSSLEQSRYDCQENSKFLFYERSGYDTNATIESTMRQIFRASYLMDTQVNMIQVRRFFLSLRSSIIDFAENEHVFVLTLMT